MIGVHPEYLPLLQQTSRHSTMVYHPSHATYGRNLVGYVYIVLYKYICTVLSSMVQFSAMGARNFYFHG